MTFPHKLYALLGSLALVAGCGDDRSKSKDTTRPTQPERGTNGDGASAFRAERDVVPIQPGGEAQVKLMNVPKEREMAVTLEPAASRLEVTVNRGTLTIRAGDDATGETVATVKAGSKSARVTIKVEGGKK